METPAGNASGPSTEPAGNGSDAESNTFELPPKLRVHALAKLLGTSSREVITTLDSLGESVRSAQSNISRELALRVVQTLRPARDDGGSAPKRVRESDETAPETASAEGAADTGSGTTASAGAAPAAPQAMFLAPEPPPATAKQPEPDRSKPEQPVREAPAEVPDEVPDEPEEDTDEDGDQAGRRRRRRGRRGRGRGRGGDEQGDALETSEQTSQESVAPERPAQAERTEKADKPERGGKQGKQGKKNKGGDSGGKKKDKPVEAAAEEAAPVQPAEADAQDDTGEAASNRRRRRRRRKGSGDGDGSTREDDPPNTVVHVRETPDNERQDSGEDEVRAIKGSTRLEAKRQRRRDGRDTGRRRAPVLSESEFLARRESVDRRMVVREQGDQTQVAVLEDQVLVENFVTSSGNGSLVGNVYLGKVQNVLPSMEAAFVDIGKGRNAVLYAGEVDWDAAGLAGKGRRIEQALSTGDSVLVQITKDPMGHKGARLTTQISLPGRFLVYVPGGSATGISRKLPDNERKRLKEILKRIVPENSGVIIRTASEGTSEQALEHDVRRLEAQWKVIKEKADTPKAPAPQLLYEEPDLLIKVVRDLFTEDFSSLTVQGNDAWDTIEAYVQHVAPDLMSRLTKHTGSGDVFAEQRIDEQITKALDRKVWLPSGGYLVIDRTEAMTVIDVNTGKFTGSGGNLEETVTRNNLESAEEIVRQLRLRDIGGIIVIDFIDMVLEANRDLVLRRLTECLGRDRTRHQVAEVTSLGLVQMTRKRVGTGLLEAYSTTCEHCRGRGVFVTTELTDHSQHANHSQQANHSGNGGGGGSRRNRRKGGQQETQPETAEAHQPASPAKSDKSDKADKGEKSGKADKGEKGANKQASAPAAVEQPARESDDRETGRRRKRDQQSQDAQPRSGDDTGRAKAPVAQTADTRQPVSDSESGVASREQSAEPAASEGRSKRRKVSRPAGSVGSAPAPAPAPAPVVVTPNNDQAEPAESGTEVAGSGNTAEVAAPAARRPRRRAAGRPTGPPV